MTKFVVCMDGDCREWAIHKCQACEFFYCPKHIYNAVCRDCWGNDFEGANPDFLKKQELPQTSCGSFPDLTQAHAYYEIESEPKHVFNCADEDGGIGDVTDCSIAPIPKIWVRARLWHELVELAGKYDHEWLAYGIGKVGRHAAYIKEVYFPKQSVSAATVRRSPESGEILPATIASIHSHVRMAAFFSQTDVEHANWPVEIVLNARGEYKASMRVKLACGRFKRQDGRVQLRQKESKLATKLQEELGKKVEASVTKSYKAVHRLIFKEFGGMISPW